MNRLINSINCVSFGTINTSDKALSRRNNSTTLWQHLTVINQQNKSLSVLSTYSKWALYKLCTGAFGHNWLRENLKCCYIPTFCWRLLKSVTSLPHTWASSSEAGWWRSCYAGRSPDTFPPACFPPLPCWCTSRCRGPIPGCRGWSQ